MTDQEPTKPLSFRLRLRLRLAAWLDRRADKAERSAAYLMLLAASSLSRQLDRQAGMERTLADAAACRAGAMRDLAGWLRGGAGGRDNHA